METITISKKDYDKAAIAAAKKVIDEVNADSTTNMLVIAVGMILTKEMRDILFKEENEDGSK